MAKRNKRREEQEQTRAPTRKEQRQRRHTRERNRKLMTGAGIAIGLALLVVVYGLVSEFALRPNSTVATVGETELVTRDFWKRVYLQQNRLQNQFIRLQQLQGQFGGQGQNFLTSQLNQIQATLSSPFTLGVEVLDEMIREEVVRVEAAERGITVTEEEIDQALREEVAARQNAVTSGQATATAEAGDAATATATQWTPTPTATIDASSTVTGATTPDATPPASPTLSVLTDQQYQEGLQELEEGLQEIANISLQEYRRVVEARLLDEKLREAVTEDLVEPTQVQVHARHILLNVSSPTPESAETAEEEDGEESAAEPTATATPLPEGFPTPAPTPEPRDDEETLALAQEIRQRLLDGEDFAELAEQYSDDPGSAQNGGDLGWFSRGDMVESFEEAAFNLEAGEISEPVRSDFGYHIIEVIEKDDSRPKDEQTLEQERAQAYQAWLEERIAEAEVQRPDDILAKLPRNLEPAVPGAPGQQQQGVPAQQNVPNPNQQQTQPGMP